MYGNHASDTSTWRYLVHDIYSNDEEYKSGSGVIVNNNIIFRKKRLTSIYYSLLYKYIMQSINVRIII
jgi:hypothetical protein